MRRNIKGLVAKENFKMMFIDYGNKSIVFKIQLYL